MSSEDSYEPTIGDQEEFYVENSPQVKDSYYNLQKMREVHHEIVRRLVLGQKIKVIAEQLGVTEAMVQYTKNSPIVKQHMRIIQGARDHSTAEVMEQIREIAPLALNKLEEILISESANDTDKRLVAKDLLDRAGYNPIHKHDHRHAHLTSSDLDNIKNKAKEAGKQNGLIVSNPESPNSGVTNCDTEEKGDDTNGS